MRLCVSLFCLLISFAHHCYPDDGRGIRAVGGRREEERRRVPSSSRSLPPPSSPRANLPFCTALYIISVQSTQPLDPLWLMDCLQRFSFWTWDSKFNLSLCPQDFLIKSDYSLKYLMLSLMFKFFYVLMYKYQI